MYSDKKFEISVQGSAGDRRVSVTGELDAATVDDLAQVLSGLVEGDAVIDLCDVRFLDTAAIEMFLRLKQGNSKVRFLTSGRLDRILRLAGVQEQFVGADSPDLAE